MATHLINQIWNSEEFRTYLHITKKYANVVRDYINNVCRGRESWEIICVTFLLTLIFVWFHSFIFKDDSIIVRLKTWIFKSARGLPFIKQVIRSQINKQGEQLHNNISKLFDGIEYKQRLPEKGLTEDQLTNELAKCVNKGDVNWSDGKASGAVYNDDSGLSRILAKVYAMTAYTNPLHSEIFPGILAMESNIVRMTSSLFNGGPDTCGSVSSGGTESIFLACKTYRDYGLHRKGIKKPEMIICSTTHAAFGKSAMTLGIKMKVVRTDPVTMKIDTRQLKRAINKNTIMLVGSAPQYPHGVIDDIEEISELGVKYNVPVHVDACLGGFLIVFMDKAGFKLKPFDFRLPGVTSISVDTHKYAFAPKGSSVILYKNSDYLHYQYFVLTDWSGGVYGTTTLAGSRAGSLIASCWASLLYFGEDRYVQMTRKIIDTTRYIETRLRKIDGVKIIGKPEVSIVAFTSDYFNIYAFNKRMIKLGWNLSILQFPSSVHICITAMHVKPGVADKFISDTTSVAEILNKLPKNSADGSAAMYGLAQSIPDRSIVSEIAWFYLDACCAVKIKQ